MYYYSSMLEANGRLKWVERGGKMGNGDSEYGQHFQTSLAEMNGNMRSKNLF